MTSNFYKLFFISIISIFIGLIYSALQERMVFQGGIVWDAEAYVQMAKEFSAGNQISGLKPFVFRIGTPILVGVFFKNDIIFGFEFFNILFGSLTVFILAAYLWKFTKRFDVIFMVICMWIINPHSPFRFGKLYPGTVDPSVLFIITCILFIHLHWIKQSWKKTLLLCSLSAVGILFREIAIVAVLAVTLDFKKNYKFYANLNDFIKAMLPLVVCIFIILAIRFFVNGIGDYTFIGAIKDSLIHSNLKSLALSFMIPFGPIVGIFIQNRKMILNFLVNENLFLGIYFIFIFILAIIGGSHTDRFVYWAFPVVLPMLAISLEKVTFKYNLKSIFSILVILVLQSFAFRAVVQLPNFDINSSLAAGAPEIWLLAPYGGNTNTTHTYGSYMPKEFQNIVLLEYTVAICIIAYLFSKLHALNSHANSAAIQRQSVN